MLRGKNKNHKGLLSLVFAVLFLFTSLKESKAQRIVGYFPNYNYTATNYQNIQYNKLTHLNYFSLNPKRTPSSGQTDGSLWTNDPYSWFTSTSFTNVVAKARAVNPNIKIFITTGGSPGSDSDLNTRLEYIGSNASVLNTFCNNIVSFIKTNSLDGWDLDWEFPTTASARAAHLNLVSKMRQKFDSVNSKDCKNYEITIAVGGGYTDPTHTCWNPAHTDYLDCSVISYIDYLNVMSYDGDHSSTSGCSGSSHEDYTWVFQKSFNDWVTKCSVPASKFVMGVGFYNNSGTAFNSGGNNSTWYNMTTYSGGSGCPDMQSKISWIKSKGGSGIMIWELTQDNLCSGTVPSCYSLLDCIYQYTIANWGTWTASSASCGTCRQPSLGSDLSTCSGTTLPVTLNSNTPTASGVTFTWYKNGSVIGSATSPTYSATTTGTYVVQRDSTGGCTKRDTIVISNTLATPDIGSGTVNLCNPATTSFTVSNSSSFPAGTTWQWAADYGSGYTNIAGATTTTLSNIRTAATYKITATAGSCTASSTRVVTSSLPTPGDNCISGAGTINLSVTNPGLGAGPYYWYAAASGGSSLATGTSYSPTVASTTTFYVQDGSSTASYSVGLTGPPNSFQNPTGTSIGLNFTLANSVTINTVDVYAPIETGTVQIIIEDASGTTVFSGPSTNINSAANKTKYTVTVGATLAAGNYKMVATGTANLYVSSAPTYPLTNNDVSITGSFGLGSYAFFYNWNVSSGSGCARLPVVAQVGGCSLPIGFSSFYVTDNSDKVLLNWTTAWESNSGYFEVQRSINGVEFESIGRVVSVHNSLNNNYYSFIDENPSTSVVYYRIAEHDFNGAIEYSDIRILNRSIALDVSVDPNPFEYSTKIRFGKNNGPVDIKILNSNGSMVREIEGSGGEIEIGSDLAQGIYIVQVVLNDQIFTRRIIKIH